MPLSLLHFLAAITFLTRIPLPKPVNLSAEDFKLSTPYFPLAGLAIGAISAVLFWLCTFFFSPFLSIVISISITCMITGALHEDGFSDVCDGLGGGGEKEQILQIMKDSRVGAFGVMGLILIIGLKLAALYDISTLSVDNLTSNKTPTEAVIISFILAHGLSRLCAISYMRYLDYVQAMGASKVQSQVSSLSNQQLAWAFMSLLPAMILVSASAVFMTLLILFIVNYMFAVYLKRRLDGYTGDCLGAAQQLSEVMIYLVIASQGI